MKKSSAFTLLEVAIAIIAIALVAGVVQVSKKLIGGAENLVALNQADNDWEGSGNSEAGNEGGSTAECSSETGTLDTTSVPGEAIYIFTTVGNHSLECTGDTTAQILVVGGGGSGAGGGGGTNGGGGGGAGGVVYAAEYPITSNTYSIVVGDGGIGPNSNTGGQDGGFSQFGTMVADGGGGGGIFHSGASIDGRDGGSGGGGRYDSTPGATTQTAQTNATEFHGHSAASQSGPASGNPAMGGGGAGSSSGQISNISQRVKIGSNGGDGVEYDITGSSTFYAAGGGGSNGCAGVQDNGAGGIGGSGIGGNGDKCTGGSYDATSGVDGTGSGGGGASYLTNVGDGGSGIVIVRYASE